MSRLDSVHSFMTCTIICPYNNAMYMCKYKRHHYYHLHILSVCVTLLPTIVANGLVLVAAFVVAVINYNAPST